MTGSAANADRPAIAKTDGGLLLVVRLTPGASANRIVGLETRDDGQEVLRVSVTAPPEKGKANQALIALLAKQLGVAKSAISLQSGETSRQKLLEVQGDAEGLAARLS